jgi:hypothetical protein
MMDNSEKFHAHLNWRHIEAAVLDVFYENIACEQTADDSCKSQADTWGIHSELRSDLWERTRSFWVNRTTKRQVDFPYSVDFVCQLYFRFRKRNKDELKEYYRSINEERNLF